MRGRDKSRRGAVLPLAAVALVVLFGLLAFTIDLGYIVTSQMELQNAADAAALAGARKLSTATGTTSAIQTACITEAQRVALLNQCGKKTVQLSSSDVSVGYIPSPTDPTSPFSATTPFNCVQVTTRRDSTTNGSLSLFFAPLLGAKTNNLKATATAAMGGNVKGFSFSNSSSGTCTLLPFALLNTTWNSVTTGSGTDKWSYDPSTKTVSAGSDGTKEVSLYPSNTGSPGNFGTVNFGQNSNSTSILNRQILSGPNASDMNSMGGQIALGSNGTLALTGNPGISAGVSSSLVSIIGQPRTIPLYSTVTSSGANAQYTIVGFAGIIITKVQLTGGNKYITIQPQWVKDATAFGGGPTSTNSYITVGVQLVR